MQRHRATTAAVGPSGSLLTVAAPAKHDPNGDETANHVEENEAYYDTYVVHSDLPASAGLRQH